MTGLEWKKIVDFDNYSVSKGLEALKIVERDCEDLEEVPYGEFALIEKSLKALDIIKETKNIKVSFYENGSGKHYKIEFDKTRNQTITEEEFNLLKEVLE